MVKIDTLKMVLDLIKEQPRRFTELEKLGIPKKTLERALKELEKLGVIYKDEEDGRWSWFLRQRKTTEKYKEHINEVTLGFELLTLDLKDPSYYLTSYNLVYEDEETPYEKQLLKMPYWKYLSLKNFALEHLKTGYPKVYEIYKNYVKSMEDFFKQKDKYKKLYEKISEFYDDPLIKHLENLHSSFHREIGIIISKTKFRGKLKGYCEVCKMEK